MDQLAVELARLLNISVEQAVELYPHIRTQLLWYKTVNSIGLYLFLAGLVLFLFIALYIWGIYDKYYIEDKTLSPDEEYELAKHVRRVRRMILAFIIMTVIFITLDLAVPYATPDLQMLLLIFN